MPVLTDFIPLREIARNSAAVVHLAHPAGEAGVRVALKIITPPLPRGPARELLLRRARAAAVAQEQAAAAAPAVWARVHGAGIDRKGASAWTATTHCRRTLQKVAEARAAVSPAALHRLTGATIEALSALEKHAARVHGALTPANVLIHGTGALEKCRPLLTDPAPLAPAAAAVRPATRAADNRALGLIIATLVRRRPQTGNHVEDGPEWRPLGKHAAAWRDFCNFLLDPHPAPEATALAEVARRFAALGGKPLSTRARLALALLPLACAAAPFAGLRLAPFETLPENWQEFAIQLGNLPPDVEEVPPEHRQLCDAWNEWFGALRDEIRRNDPATGAPVRDLWLADPALATAVAAADNAADAGAPLDPRILCGEELPFDALRDNPPRAAKRGLVVRRTKAAAARLAAVAAALSQWQGNARLATHADTAETAGFAAAAAELRPAAFPEINSGRAAAEITRRLRLLAAAAAAEKAWEPASADLATLAATGDPVLAAIPPRLAAALAAAPLAQLPAQIAAHAVPATARAAFVRENWETRLDRARWLREGFPKTFSGDATDAALARWDAEIANFLWLEPAADPRAAADWDARQKRLRDETDALTREDIALYREPTDAPPLEKQTTALLAAAAALRERKAIRADAPALRAETAALAARFDAAFAALARARAALNPAPDVWLAAARVAELPVPQSGTGGSPVSPQSASTPQSSAVRSPLECGTSVPLLAGTSVPRASNSPEKNAAASPSPSLPSAFPAAPARETEVFAQSGTEVPHSKTRSDSLNSGVEANARTTGEPPVPLPAAALTAEWRARRDKLLDGVTAAQLAADDADYRARRRVHRKTRDFLAALATYAVPAAAPTPPPPQSGTGGSPIARRLADALREREAQFFADIVAKIPWASDGVPALTPQAYANTTDVRAALDALAHFRKTAPAAAALFAELRVLLWEQGCGAGHPALETCEKQLADPTLAAAARLLAQDGEPAALDAILVRLRAIAAATQREPLLEVLNNSETQPLALRVTAYRRLDALANWPATLDELDADLAHAKTLAAAAQSGTGGSPVFRAADSPLPTTSADIRSPLECGTSVPLLAGTSVPCASNSPEKNAAASPSPSLPSAFPDAPARETEVFAQSGTEVPHSKTRSDSLNSGVEANVGSTGEPPVPLPAAAVSPASILLVSPAPAPSPQTRRRLAALAAELDATAKARWFRAYDTLPAAQTPQVLERLATAGLSADALARLDRFDYLLARAKTAGWQTLSRKQLADAKDRLAADLAATADGHPDAIAFASALAAIRLDTADTADASPVADIGPARAGWADTLGADADRLTYTLRDLAGNTRVQEYLLVEPRGAPPFFLASRAVSVGDFIALVESRAEGAAVIAALPAWIDDVSRGLDADSREGPQTWRVLPRRRASAERLHDSRLALATRWNAYVDPRWPDPLHAPALPPPGAPNARHPVQSIPPEAARLFAEKVLGARLATPDEWRAVAALHPERARPAAHGSNFSDSAWETQRAYLASKGAATGFPWPGSGAFQPAAAAAPAPAAAAPYAPAASDGHLWFAEVGEPGAPTFTHLFGNVATWLRDPATGAFHVAGGSAISPATIDPATPYRADQFSEGHADVGIRPAFAAPPEFLRLRQLLLVIRNQPYLRQTKPRPAPTQ